MSAKIYGGYAIMFVGPPWIMVGNLCSVRGPLTRTQEKYDLAR